jgi:hypothetical protein
LSAIRRNAKLLPEQEEHGIRDVAAFRSLLTCLEHLEQREADKQVKHFLGVVLNRFLVLRQNSRVTLVRVGRYSAEQLSTLISRLLASASGGRWPVMLATAMFRAMNEQWSLGWEVAAQGINVADGPTGAAGDITVTKSDSIVLAAEVTERTVDKTRVITTFNAKITDAQIKDYIFFAPVNEASGATIQAQQYFAQGHEINFLDLRLWLLNMLVTIGSEGRHKFAAHILSLLDQDSTPTNLKVSWNSIANDIAGGS